MKKRLFTTNKEAGFILPIVLFAAVIIMTIISSQIYIYRQDMQITDNYLEQVKMETLFQMSLQKAKQDLPAIESFPAYLSYEFQDGNVTVHIPEESNQLTFHIYTEANKAQSTIVYHL